MSGSLDGSLKVLDLYNRAAQGYAPKRKGGRVRKSALTFGKAVERVQFVDDRRVIATTVRGEVKRMWDVETGRELPCPQLDARDPLAFDRPGQWLATGGKRGISLWDFLSGEEVASFKGDSQLSSCADPGWAHVGRRRVRRRGAHPALRRRDTAGLGYAAALPTPPRAKGRTPSTPRRGACPLPQKTRNTSGRYRNLCAANTSPPGKKPPAKA